MDPELSAKVAPFHLAVLSSVPVTVKLPETVRVEIELVRVAVVVWEPFAGTVVLPTWMEAQLIVPEPVREALVFAPAAFCSVMLPDTVKTIPTFTERVAVLVLALLNVIDAIVRSSVTVTESPARITTASVDAGIVPPGHGAFTVVEFQLPLPAVVMVAASADEPELRITPNNRIETMFPIRKQLGNTVSRVPS